MSDQELSEVLQQVNLQDVLTRVGGFDQEVPWENILSLGAHVERLDLHAHVHKQRGFQALGGASLIDGVSQIAPFDAAAKQALLEAI
ncbi:hypothetical protein L2E69_18115 [Planktothrix agardhii 1806]|uniref:hypothetical protein n=1 Tax=Planktothrix agardhii TaxID=1160 RepID=UPI001F16250F|nr:hypothetical protein [Planktothrix agardhii]MCF3617848.1 hypothetical protein [Planktothrix agardhii 1806]